MASKDESFTKCLLASGAATSKTPFTDNTDVLDVVEFPCLKDEDTIEFLRSHGRVVFFSRGPPGSGKGPVSSRLHELYPGSLLYWADQMFIGPNARIRTKETLQESHVVCVEKTAQYMEQNAPILIIRNSNINVREISPYLQLAATHGYLVVILDNEKYLTYEPQVLAGTNTKDLGVRYMVNRLKQWEDVHPFAMGWCPKPRDAAWLLRRYNEIAVNLIKCNNHTELKPILNARVFPFCLARVCWFGWDDKNRDYCCSELVLKAYGLKDTISVIGYAVLGDLVVAVVRLTDGQAALIGDSEGGAYISDTKNGDKRECSQNVAFSSRPVALEIDEMQCAFDLDAFSTQDTSYEVALLQPLNQELPSPSRVSFIILGSTSTEPITYSEAVHRCTFSLHDALLSWRDTSAPVARMDVSGITVYGTSSGNGRPLLVMDNKTVKLNVVFSGYYQSHTTRSSRRCRTWSTGATSGKRILSIPPQRVGASNDNPFHGASRGADHKRLLDGVDEPCVRDEKTQRFLRTHGRLLFLVRGPSTWSKNAVVAELEALYPVSRAYLPDKPPMKDSATLRELHELCLNKAESFMKADDAMIINNNSNFMVWEISNFLALASRHGYTVIIVDLPFQQHTLYRKILSAANKEQDGSSTAINRKQWEDVHPFAMGWSPRPKDAARLLSRFRQLRAALHNEDRTLAPRDVSSSQVFPFCMARLCRFGRTTEDRDYCKSEKVRKAYGRCDTIRVFGYAVVQGYMFALVELNEEQASLTRITVGATGEGDADALPCRLEAGLSMQSWDEVSCIVDLSKFSSKEDGSEQDDALRQVGLRISLKDVEASRVTFIPLGSIEGTKFSYSVAAAAPWALLSSRLRFWAAQLAQGVDYAERVAGIDVYGCTSLADGVLLLMDSVTVELDVVFTGYYHPHTTTDREVIEESPPHIHGTFFLTEPCANTITACITACHVY